MIFDQTVEVESGECFSAELLKLKDHLLCEIQNNDSCIVGEYFRDFSENSFSLVFLSQIQKLWRTRILQFTCPCKSESFNICMNY